MQNNLVKENYQKELDSILESVQKQNEERGVKQTLLLHACCAPCSSYVLEYLSKYFDITIYYYNPNIFPPQEYERRLGELENFLPRFLPAHDVKLVKADYFQNEYYDAVKTLTEPALQTEHEKGERCRRCYEFRMRAAYEFAVAKKYNWFTTTLSISPFKDAQKINVIGKSLESENQRGPKFLTSDFKKKSGFLRSLEISSEYGLYRQQYCGCEYSMKNNSLI